MCPICSRHLGPEASNADLNEHLDLCLNQDAFAEIADAAPSPKRAASGGDTRPAKRRRTAGSGSSKKAAGKGSVLEWLRRG